MGVHFEFTEEAPRRIRRGDWILWFSEAGQAPQMAQVQAIAKEGQEWRIETNLGVMIAHDYDIVRRIE